MRVNFRVTYTNVLLLCKRSNWINRKSVSNNKSIPIIVGENNSCCKWLFFWVESYGWWEGSREGKREKISFAWKKWKSFYHVLKKKKKKSLCFFFTSSTKFYVPKLPPPRPSERSIDEPLYGNNESPLSVSKHVSVL